MYNWTKLASFPPVLNFQTCKKIWIQIFYSYQTCQKVDLGQVYLCPRTNFHLISSLIFFYIFEYFLSNFHPHDKLNPYINYGMDCALLSGLVISAGEFRKFRNYSRTDEINLQIDKQLVLCTGTFCFLTQTTSIITMASQTPTM